MDYIFFLMTLLLGQGRSWCFACLTLSVSPCSICGDVSGHARPCATRSPAARGLRRWPACRGWPALGKGTAMAWSALDPHSPSSPACTTCWTSSQAYTRDWPRRWRLQRTSFLTLYSGRVLLSYTCDNNNMISHSIQNTMLLCYYATMILCCLCQTWNL